MKLRSKLAKKRFDSFTVALFARVVFGAVDRGRLDLFVTRGAFL